MYKYLITSKKPLNPDKIKQVAKNEGEDVDAEEVDQKAKILTGPKWKDKKGK